jgi:putative intracellular protease/amidase
MRLVHVAVYDGMADWEVGHVLAHINNGQWQRDEPAARVVTVGERPGGITTMGGLRISPDVLLTDVRPGESAMLVLPGADSWLAGQNEAFVDKARQFLDAGVPVAAICGATAGLARAGLLDDRAHTSNAEEFLAATGYAGGAHYRNVPALTDGDLITGSGIAPVEFAREVLARLDLYEPSVLESWYKLYGLHDPEGYEELIGAGAG